MIRRSFAAAFLVLVFLFAYTGNATLAHESQASASNPKPIEVAMIQSDEISVPADFQVALYENLIRQLQKQGFQQVYRDGDRDAAGINDRIVLHSTVRAFKAGSEEKRQVTTVTGATSITVHCRFTTPEGRTLVEQDVVGKVRFFGGNLRATYDFAKKAAHVAHTNFIPASGN